MADYGVTSAGFKRKRLADILIEIQQSLQTTFGNSINLLPSSLVSNFVGIFSEREDALWELAEDLYNSAFLGSATGVPLQNVLALLGVTKLPATKSIQRGLYLFGTPGAIIPVGTQIRVAGNPLATFATVASIQLVAGQDEIQRIRFSAAPTSGSYVLRYINQDTVSLPYNANAAAVQAALQALPKLAGGTITVTGDPTSLQHFDIDFGGNNGAIQHAPLLVPTSTLAGVGGPVTLAYLNNTQDAIPQGQVDAEALDYGPTAAPLYTLTEIVTPVTGLTRALNITDADVGRYLEDDNTVRTRSSTAQAGLGRGSPNAITARLEELDGVSKAITFQNENDTTDTNGLPPHSIRAYVAGGANQDIFQCIWDSKAAGIKSDGTVSGTIIDSDGIVQPVNFSRPTIVPIYITAQVNQTDSTFPTTGAQQIKDALAAYIGSLGIGDDVITYPKMMAALTNIAGLLSVTLKVGKTASPTSDANIIIATQEIAEIINEATDIVVTGV